MQCCAMGKLTGMTSDPRLAISHHCENRVPGRKDWKDTTAMAAVARVIWWAPRAVGLERQSQDLADHSGLGWAGGALGGETNLLSLPLKCQPLSLSPSSAGSSHQVCGFVFLQQPCDVRLPQGQGHRVTQTRRIQEPGLPIPGCLAQSKMLHLPQASVSPSATWGPKLQLV